MVYINRKTGIITADNGWLLKMSFHSIEARRDDESYILSCEVVDEGQRVIVYDSLVQKGADPNRASEIRRVIERALQELGLVVEIG